MYTPFIQGLHFLKVPSIIFRIWCTQIPRLKVPITVSQLLFYFDYVNLINATQIIISPLKFVRNRFKLIISRKYFRNQYFNLRKIAFSAVNLTSLALLSLLTSKMLPNREDLSSTHHFPQLIWQLTSIIDLFWDHFWAWLTKKVVNLTWINLNLLTLLWEGILVWRSQLTSMILTFLES